MYAGLRFFEIISPISTKFFTYTLLGMGNVLSHFILIPGRGEKNGSL